MRDCNDFSLFQIEFVWVRIYYIHFFSKASCVQLDLSNIDNPTLGSLACKGINKIYT